MRKIVKSKFIRIVFVVVLVSLMCYAFKFVSTTAFALENSDDKILNPQWVIYNESTEEEREKYVIIPEKYIYSNSTSNYIIDDDLPTQFNLTDVDGVNYVSDNVKDQGMSGLCWLYSSLTSFESNIRKNFNENVSFSIRQFDYSRSNSISEYQRLKIDSPYYRDKLGNGGSFDEFEGQLLYGIVPIENGTANMLSDNSGIQATISSVFNLDEVKYYVTDTISFGTSNYDLGDTNYVNWQNGVKTFLKNNGAMYLASYFNSACMYHDDYTNTDVLDTNYCGTTAPHAVTLIGWDDDYEYAFCKTDKGTSSDLSNCENIVSGRGAWIAQNSWGEKNKPYVYITYKSDKISEIAGINEIKKKDWDNNYDINKVIASTHYEKTFISNKNEKVTRISFDIPSSNDANYKIYLKNNDGEYHLITQGSVTKKGIYSIDLSDDESDYLYLDGGTISLKYEYDFPFGVNVYAYSKVVDLGNDITAETYVGDDDIYTYTSNINIYTSTHNIKNGETLSYKVKDSNNNDVTDNFDFQSYYVLNNIEKVKMSLINVTDSNYTIETYYNDVLYDTTQINIKPFEPIGDSGNGSISDPFIINSIEDLEEINEKGGQYLNLSYALGSDINMYEYLLTNEWTPIGTEDNPFTGTFDGRNYSINNLYIENEYAGLFGYTDGATIKNITLWGTNICGRQAGALISNSKNSNISNIIVTGNVYYKYYPVSDYVSSLGSVIGVSSSDKLEKISSYASVGSYDWAYKTHYIGGIVGYASDIVMDQIYYKGDLFNGSIIGGLIGDATGIRIENSTVIANISKYNSASGLVGLLKKSYPGSRVISGSSISCIFLNITFDGDGYEIYNSEQESVKVAQIYYVDNGKSTGILDVCSTRPYDNCYNVFGISREDFYVPATYSSVDFEAIYLYFSEEDRTLKLSDEGYPIPYHMPVLELDNNISSEKYTVDEINGYIYDIKVASHNKPYVTVNSFSDNILATNYRLFKYDLSKELSDSDKISTNDVLLIDGRYYILSVLGDCYCDGKFDGGDAVAILRYAVELPNPGRRNNYACDVNKNHEIGSFDSEKILRHEVGLDTDLYGGE